MPTYYAARGGPPLTVDRPAYTGRPVDVFVSHKSDDSPLAAKVAAAIRNNDLDVWLDIADPNIGNAGPDLAEYIQGVLRHSKALMAVVTGNTKGSWWVPFEIGMAFEMPRWLTSFGNKNLNPEFLLKWPNVPDNPPGDPARNARLDDWCATIRRLGRQPSGPTYMTEMRAMARSY